MLNIQQLLTKWCLNEIKISLKVAVSFLWPSSLKLEILFFHHLMPLEPTGSRKFQIHLLELDAPEGLEEKISVYTFWTEPTS